MQNDYQKICRCGNKMRTVRKNNDGTTFLYCVCKRCKRVFYRNQFWTIQEWHNWKSNMD